MFETFEPTSFDPIQALLPSIGQVVTIETCVYYLSLVERISHIRDQFAEHLDALHARAEMRYEYWVDGCKKAIPGPCVAPPIDVAYIMHAHLVSPFRYYEDCVRLNLPMLPMPFKQLHIQQDQPTEASLKFWETCAPSTEPYLLTLDDILSDISLKSPCHHCGSVLSISGSDYGYWRFHPTAFIKCWSCNAETNMHHMAMAHLMNDIGNDKNHVRGTMISSVGQLKQVSMQKTLDSIDAKTYFEGYCEGQQKPLRSLPSRGSNKSDIPEPFLAMCRDKHRLAATNSMSQVDALLLSACSSSKSSEKKDMQALLRSLRWTYSDTNPSPFSLDLLQAVERQHVVGARMLQVNWTLPDALVRGLRNYKDFLLLMKNDPSLIGVPTLEIDVSWHTHQCHPVDYRRFTLQYIGRVINHDDTIPQYKLDIYSGHTRMAWSRKSHLNRMKKSYGKMNWFSRKELDFGKDYAHGGFQIEERVYTCCCQHHHHHHHHQQQQEQNEIKDHNKTNQDVEMPLVDSSLSLQEQKTILLTKKPAYSKDHRVTSHS
ncbi:hypothetical protein BCR42DRAFT_489634 [Absidia repens]|uniref:Uncharacterized protein n=1 Tax=Absidia repens TaxID=90262 RepID=A0A1X2IQI2_9FUNG|nr:hypothetical protein BCR42DRAFT_489634 [Absidia repens]